MNLNLNLEIERSLLEAFQATDEDLLESFQGELAADPVPPPPQPPNFASPAAQALHAAALATHDAALAREKLLCYASSTGVSLLLVGTTLGVGHIGDSRVCVGRRRKGRGAASVVDASFLTLDHKPDIPGERARIVGSGGAVVYLHNQRPYIRGGDFAAQQALGRKPMQLNYSRAFGGLRLKPYGLSATPDFRFQEIDPSVYTVVILGSDGLWDIFADPADACARALDAHFAGKDPSALLVNHALAEHVARNTQDNVTCFVLVFTPVAA